jgi:hypothetical protein
MMRVIKLTLEFCCWPLWEIFPDTFSENTDPATLPISKELQHRLINWGADYDATLDQNYPPDSGFKNQEEVDAFKAEGVYLESQLRTELGSNFCVITSDTDVSIRTI